MVDKDSEEDNTDDEARELDHSKISDSQKDGNKEDTESEEVEEEEKHKRDTDSEEGIIEVIFDSGGTKVSKKINLIPGLQLVLKDGELGEEEEEVENIDAEVEEDNIITREEGDGK